MNELEGMATFLTTYYPDGFKDNKALELAMMDYYSDIGLTTKLLAVSAGAYDIQYNVKISPTDYLPIYVTIIGYLKESGFYKYKVTGSDATWDIK